ncbi:protein kinase domain-containing protein [Actinophytocola xinjiangensis]|uniref:protein kinase domain-containing protein n=1 Tax=Actinophytocola xinjiangensis TaxID=485602 RepID=UPI00138FC6F0|nr:protein kinase [Actinophytocola xinjiangensis]
MIADRYELLDRIGSGGMGTVWRATDQLLRRTVAVKEVHLLARGEELTKRRRRAHREARAIARISHPGVIDIYDLVDHEDRLWMVMELVDGPSLADVPAGSMSPARVADIGAQLLSALDAVHSTGALHRDVKPSNVLLRADGRVVLCDFGIVALADTESITQSGALVGSLEYIAPERLSDRPAGPASDLFSLGCTLYSLLTGRSPFSRAEAFAVMHAVLQDQPVIPQNVGPLGLLLEALLRKDPAQRPSVAEAMRLLGPATAVATVPGHPGLVRRGRRQVLRWAAGLAVLVPGAVAVGLVLNGSSEGTGPPADPGDTASPAGLTGIDAAIPIPGVSDWFWVFSGDRYCRVATSAAGHPIGERATELTPITNWANTFGVLPDFRGGIDAVLPVPGRRDEYWVFAGDRYVRIGVAEVTYEDTLLAEPAPVSDWATAFRSQPGFLTGIDAVMPTPDSPDQFWVFSGKEYVRILLAGDQLDGHRLLSGPAELESWENTFGVLPDFRGGVDAVLPVPGRRGEYWVFAGGRYARIGVADGTYDDTLVRDSSPLSD